ncbi:hypothetical protein, partial [Stenotrophomonas sp. YIM B06876]|uniref:hypothetical protein n=1 Tax=Stenotrophomonas sp. YIM B06876 TaxID=3060211 RepID=UPI002738ECAA
MDSDSAWAQGAQQFQQIFGESWSRALQSFQGTGLGKTPAVPALHFSTEKLQALQQQYMEQARELWSQGLQGAPTTGADKRFSG